MCTVCFYVTVHSVSIMFVCMQYIVCFLCMFLYSTMLSMCVSVYYTVFVHFPEQNTAYTLPTFCCDVSMLFLVHFAVFVLCIFFVLYTIFQ